MPTPQDKSLYARVKQEADAKFLAPTSAYKSAWIVTQYKKRGGIYKEDGDKHGLTQWFQEKWVDLNRPKRDAKSGKVIGYEECGRNVATTKGQYPLCRPSKRVNQSTPKTVREIDPLQVPKIERQKSKVKQNGRVKF
jgi:hypothetical protein